MSEPQFVNGRVKIKFRFNYHHEDDSLEFVFHMGRAPLVGLRLPADHFLQLIDLIVKVWGPYSESLKEKRAAGVKEDSTATFDTDQWNKMMEANDV